MSQTESIGMASWRETYVVPRWVEASMPEPIVKELRLLAFYAETSRPRIAKLVDRLNLAGMNPPNPADMHAATRQCLEAVLMLMETHARLARLLDCDVITEMQDLDPHPRAASDMDKLPTNSTTAARNDTDARAA